MLLSESFWKLPGSSETASGLTLCLNPTSGSVWASPRLWVQCEVLLSVMFLLKGSLKTPCLNRVCPLTLCFQKDLTPSIRNGNGLSCKGTRGTGCPLLGAGESQCHSAPCLQSWQQWRKLFFMFWSCKHWLTLQIFLHAWQQAPRPGVKRRNQPWWQQPEPWKWWELLFPESHWWLSKCPWHAAVWQPLRPRWLVCYSDVISRFTARKSEQSNTTFFPERGWPNRTPADFPVHGLSPFNTPPALLSVLQVCL